MYLSFSIPVSRFVYISLTPDKRTGLSVCNISMEECNLTN